MPTSKIQRRGPEERNRRANPQEKSLSFHGRIPEMMPPPPQIPEARPKLTKLLLNVTIRGSLGAVQMVVTLDSTVGDLVGSAVKQYVKEGRRPILPTNDPSDFDLHYSQFSLESLDREVKLKELGSRNFFLCPKKSAVEGGLTTSSTSCAEQAEKVRNNGFTWLKF